MKIKLNPKKTNLRFIDEELAQLFERQKALKRKGCMKGRSLIRDSIRGLKNKRSTLLDTIMKKK